MFDGALLFVGEAPAVRPMGGCIMVGLASGAVRPGGYILTRNAALTLAHDILRTFRETEGEVVPAPKPRARKSEGSRA